MKPILFNTDMVRALLERRKTVTRRVVKPQPLDKPWCFHDEIDGVNIVCHVAGRDVLYNYFPPYQPGDILYVRETWAVWSRTEGLMPKIHYKSDGENLPGVKWRPSIHMPKEAARIFLRVTDVRVERLQDIDGAQAYSEGASAEVPGILESLERNDLSIFPKNFDQYSEEKKEDWYKSTATAAYIARCELTARLIRSFSGIWDSTIKPGDWDTYGWEANPWVWVIEFERCEKLNQEVPQDDGQQYAGDRDKPVLGLWRGNRNQKAE